MNPTENMQKTKVEHVCKVTKTNANLDFPNS